jgi:hypothetical protein
MDTQKAGFEQLRSDEVFLQGMHASDVRRLWCALGRTKHVRSVSRSLASDPDRIRQLCCFVEGLLDVEYDKAFRHPEDVAICAALVILEQSPLSAVRNLFARLRGMVAPSLAWIQRMAEHCTQRYVPSDRTVLANLAYGRSLPVRGIVQESPGLEWATPEVERSRYGLSVA